MSEHHSTPACTPGKPEKPYPEFPLFPHATGYWCKKIRGKLHYFSRWDEPDAALEKYLQQKDDLHAGKMPRSDRDAFAIKDAANAFLNHKQAYVDSGELSPLMFAEYKRACELIIAHFGKSRIVSDLQPNDFTLLRKRIARNNGFYRLGNMIQCIRSVFKFAFDQELIDKPIRYGQGFRRPSKKTIRLHKAKQGKKLFTRDEVRAIIDAAGIPMRATILLGINCGFGNSDCGNLPLSAVNLETGWIDYPRPKTGVDRRCPLWPETVAALRDAIANRPEPKHAEHSELVFITRRGYSWAKNTADNPITKETTKLLKALNINGHRNFYALRHTFRTIGDKTKDQPACDFIMGHARDDMASIYREEIEDERLKAVTDHMHAWLFGS
jgi:integrase